MAYNPEEDIKVSDLPEKTTDVVSDDKLLVIDSEDANILKQVDASKVGGGGSGTGDMLKSVYDTNDNGIVDNAEALGGVPASDYAKSADVQPTLESGVNIKTINGNSILGPGNIEIQGGSGTVDTEMSDSSTNAVQNKVIKGYVDTAVAGVGGGGKIFTLTGTGYFPSDGSMVRLSDEDVVIYNQAKSLYTSGGYSVIEWGNEFFIPERVSSGDISFKSVRLYRNSDYCVSFKYFGNAGGAIRAYRDTNISMRTELGYDNSYSDINLESITKYTMDISGGSTYTISGILGLTLMVKDSSDNVINALSGYFMGNFNSGYIFGMDVTNKKVGDNPYYYVRSSNQFLNFNFDNRGYGNIKLTSTGLGQPTFTFSKSKSSSYSSNSLYMNYMFKPLL